MDQGKNSSLFDRNFDADHAFNRKIMLCSVVIVFTIVIVLLYFHIYARWFFHRARGSQQRNRHLVFSADRTTTEPFKGLDPSVLKSLPTFLYLSTTHTSLLECAVCLSEFEEEDQGRLLPKCKHCFHIECIDMWFRSHSNCPLCRAPVRPDISVATTEEPLEVVISGTEPAELSSQMCPPGQRVKDRRPCSSSSSRVTELEGITVEVPRRNEMGFRRLEDQLGLGSLGDQGFRSPGALLQKALDPPDVELVEDALSLLVHLHALEKNSRGRYEPTFYGRLLASFTLSFDASVLILKFGERGMLREGILLGILMDTQPLPILRPFGQDNLFTEYTDCYFGGDGENSSTAFTGRKELVFMSNLCAFQFWQRVFKDNHRLEHLKQFIEYDEVEVSPKLLPKIEEEWCSFHKLVQSALHNVSVIYEDIVGSVHRFRPKFLVTSDGLPSYHDPYEFEHTCLFKCQPYVDTDGLTSDDEHPALASEIQECLAAPFVGSNHFRSNDVAEMLASIIKEIKIQCTEDVSSNQYHNVDDDVSHDNGEASLCRFFINGLCNKGRECLFSHSLEAKRPVCKFFLSFKGCRNGESCFFSHQLGQSVSSIRKSSVCLPEDEGANAAPLLRLLPTSSDASILIFDDTNLHFSSYLTRHCDPSKIISTTSLSETFICDASLTGVNILWGQNDPFKTLISKAGPNSVLWNEVKRVFWFPNFNRYDEMLEEYKNLLQNFFGYLAIRILVDSLYEVQVIITMNNMRFSQLQVEKLGRDCFFYLKESFPFDESSFGEFTDTLTTKKPMLVSKPISYVFELHPPTDIQFGDYTADLRRSLHAIQSNM